MAFGDSLTEACYIEGNSICGWLGGNGYERELESLLNKDPWNIVWDVRVYNYGKGGEQTFEGLSRLTSLLKNYTCDRPVNYILIMEGTNDLLQNRDINNIIFDLEQMIVEIRKYGLQILLATIPPDPDHAYKEIEPLNEKIRLLAARLQEEIILVDQYKALAPQWSTYTNPRGCYGDRTHPNDIGFNAMASVWYESLSPLMTGTLPWLMLLLGSP